MPWTEGYIETTTNGKNALSSVTHIFRKVEPIHDGDRKWKYKL